MNLQILYRQIITEKISRISASDFIITSTKVTFVHTEINPSKTCGPKEMNFDILCHIVDFFCVSEDTLSYLVRLKVSWSRYCLCKQGGATFPEIEK